MKELTNAQLSVAVEDTVHQDDPSWVKSAIKEACRRLRAVEGSPGGAVVVPEPPETPRKPAA